MTGITIEGLIPTQIEPCGDDSPHNEILTYVIGDITLRIGVTYATPYPMETYLDADDQPIHMGGYTGWSHHPDGDHIGSPYWALSSAIYGLARVAEEAGLPVRWGDPKGHSSDDWDHSILKRLG